MQISWKASLQTSGERGRGQEADAIFRKHHDVERSSETRRRRRVAQDHIQLADGDTPQQLGIGAFLARQLEFIAVLLDQGELKSTRSTVWARYR
jgi:hypothetical protein